jgi:hypothetical protein
MMLNLVFDIINELCQYFIQDEGPGQIGFQI